MLHNDPTSGHFGEIRSVALIYWFGCFQHMRLHCRCCDDCFLSKPLNRQYKALLQSVTAGGPLEMMVVDVMGELPLTKSGNTFFLVVMDYFTKFLHLIPMPDQKAVTVANAIVKEVFTKVESLDFCTLTGGTDFMSKLFQETCKLFKIDET